MRKAALHNLGCKVNAYETEAMQQILEENGYEIVPFDVGADVYIINTCTVTNIADRKSRQMLHKAKKMNPDAVVVAAGCYVQASGEELKLDPAVDLIIGNNRKQDLAEILEEYIRSREAEPKLSVEEEAGNKCHILNINHTKEYENLTIDRTAEHTRAYIKVQDGCNQFCSYCIIPYARGRVRSRKSEDICREVEVLAKAGYQEVVLTGIHLSSYGVDFEEKTGLLDLIEMVHEIDGIRRIRLGSLEPRIITDTFAKRISELPKICPHFHLSLQSGCNETLKRMNRRYTAEEYFEKCVLLRNYFEDPALTTDVIVGFPGETEEEFETTKVFLEKTAFFETHIFKYSRRKGTRAASMEHQVPEEIKALRSHELLKLNEKNREAYIRRMIGKKAEVLFEEETEKNGVPCFTGHTKEYVRVCIPSKGEDWSNKIYDCILGESDVQYI